MAFRPALLLGALTFIIMWMLISFSVGVTLAIVVTLSMTAVYFQTLREQIIVRNLLDGGRTFVCSSIVTLIQKEAYLQSISSYLRQVLESAKNWNDRERIVIAPLSKEEAKRIAQKGLLGV